MHNSGAYFIALRHNNVQGSCIDLSAKLIAMTLNPWLDFFAVAYQGCILE